MGIQGLLPLLKSIHRATELKKFSGETLAVDAYGWLHRGAVACAMELAQGKPTRKYVDFAMHRVRMLKYFGVTPYIVFDGDFLPSKALTEASRSRRREESRRAGLELLKAGKPSQAYLELQKAIDVTPEMARNLIEELKKADVPYVVAPYEADAQMVYLERQGLVNGIISEDSDLLVFGAKRLLTKLDQHGQCVEINRRDFCACREISLTGWTDAEFRHMAIFSGCDYLDGINNMGLKTAYRMIRKCKTPERVVRMLQFEGKFRVPENYLSAFKQAELTFLYQRVFCPRKRELVFLTEPDSTVDVQTMPYIGAHVDADLARAIALGEFNPISKQPIVLPSMAEKRQVGTAQPAFATQSRSLGKPIDSFFKAHQRIPLGEMDPNCFSVESRRSSGTVQDETVAPVVFPLPRPYIEDPAAGGQSPNAPRPYTTSLHRRQTEPIPSIIVGQRSSVASNVRRRTKGLALRDADADDHRQVRPRKKARLCEDTALNSSTNGQPEKSRFFSPKTNKPSESRRSDSFLMSDDSVEDALRSLPDVDSWSTSKSNRGAKALEIFQDDASIQTSSPALPDKVGERSVDSSIRKPASAGAAKTREQEQELGLVSAKTPARETLRKFVFKSKGAEAVAGTRIVNGLPTPSSRSQEPISKGPAPSFNTPLATPLQRIGVKALQRVDQQTPQPPKDRKITHPSNKRHSLERTLASLPVNPSFVPLPKVDLAEVEALNKPMGSEDDIIPDSDGDSEPDSFEWNANNEEPEPASYKSFQKRLDLSRFAYT